MAKGDGLVTMTPTSITHSGTSANINSDGSVDFSAVTSISLNGIFTSEYDNYVIVQNWNASSGMNIYYRMRTSGSDNSTASSYVRQSLSIGGTTYSGARATSDIANFSGAYGVQRAGFHLHIYGPYLAQPTALRVVMVGDDTSGNIFEVASTHNQSVSYDGISFSSQSAATMTGTLVVFGYEE